MRGHDVHAALPQIADDLRQIQFANRVVASQVRVAISYRFDFKNRQIKNGAHGIADGTAQIRTAAGFADNQRVNAKRGAGADERADIFGVGEFVNRHKKSRLGTLRVNFLKRRELWNFCDSKDALKNRIAGERFEQFLFREINGDGFRSRFKLCAKTFQMFFRHDERNDREFASQKAAHDAFAFGDENILLPMFKRTTECGIRLQFRRAEGINFFNERNHLAIVRASLPDSNGISNASKSKIARAGRDIYFYGVNLKSYLSIYATLWKNSVAREMSFKGNFILWIVVETLWFGLQLSFTLVVYGQTQSIGTWSKWQAVLLVGASSFIQQIYQAFFLTNCTGLSELVRTGKMDFLLALPVNTRFIVSTRQVDLGAFVNAAFAVCVMVYAAMKLNLHPTFAQFFGFVALCGVGIFIHYTLMFMLAAISFWTVRAQGIVWGYYNLFNIARLPDDAFAKTKAFRAVFTFALPILLVSNVPVRVLVNTLQSPVWWLLLLALGIIWAVISEWFWRFSLRRYTSAST